MAVQPFYVKANSSTRKEEVGVGVRSKDGSMTTHIYQRNEGEILEAFKIVQKSYPVLEDDNPKTDFRQLVTTIYDGAGNLLAECRTFY